VSGEVGGVFRTNSFATPSFAYAPAIGFEFNKLFDLGLRYETYTRYNVGKLSLQVACGLSVKRKTKYTSWYN
jgi:hypothetical protein